MGRFSKKSFFLKRAREFRKQPSFPFNQIRWVIHPIPYIKIVPKWSHLNMPFPMTCSTNHSRAKYQEVIFRKQSPKHEPLCPTPLHPQHSNHDCNRKHKKGDKHILHRNPRIQPFVNFIHKALNFTQENLRQYNNKAKKE